MIELADIGMLLFMLGAQVVLLLFRNILDVVILVLVVLMWRRQRQ